MFAFLSPLSRAGINILGFLLLLLWIYQGDFKTKLQTLKKNRVVLATLLFFVINFITILWSEPQNIKEGLLYDIKYEYFLLIFIFYTSFPKEKNFYLIYAFLAGMFISSLQSFSIYFHIFDIHEVNLNSLSPHMWHTIYSIFLAISSLISLSFLYHSKGVVKKIVFSILFLDFTAILFLGVSRTGQFIFIISLIILSIKHFHIKKKFLGALLLLLPISIYALYQSNTLFKDRIDLISSDIQKMAKNGDYCSSLGGRVFTWKIASKVFFKHPILGMGSGDHLIYLEEEIENDPKFSKCEIKDLIGAYHSQYIEVLSESGLLGLLSMLAIFYLLSKLRIKDPIMADIKLIFILVYLISFWIDVPFRKMFTLTLFAILTGTILLQQRKEENI